MAKAKQKPAKRKYTKRQPLPEPTVLAAPTEAAEEKDNEIEILALMCKALDEMDGIQRKRTLSFIFSKYGRYLPIKV